MFGLSKTQCVVSVVVPVVLVTAIAFAVIGRRTEVREPDVDVPPRSASPLIGQIYRDRETYQHRASQEKLTVYGRPKPLHHSLSATTSITVARSDRHVAKVGDEWRRLTFNRSRKHEPYQPPRQQLHDSEHHMQQQQQQQQQLQQQQQQQQQRPQQEHWKAQLQPLSSVGGGTGRNRLPLLGPHGPLPDPCRDERGHERRCVPDFVNAALGRPVYVAAHRTLQSKPSVASLSPAGTVSSSASGNSNRTASMKPGVVGRSGNANETLSTPPPVSSSRLDARPESQSSSEALTMTRLLTDSQVPGNASCWTPVLNATPTANGETAVNVVSLRLSLGKRFDVTYVALKFCGTPTPTATAATAIAESRTLSSSSSSSSSSASPESSSLPTPSRPPHSFAIYKSANFGRTWQPFHYYSADCPTVFGRPTHPAGGVALPVSRELEPLCSDPSAERDLRLGNNVSGVVFSTLRDRPSAFRLERSPPLREWIAVTDIRIDLFFGPAAASAVGVASEASVSALAAASISDVAVGGRCRCNGHASRCLSAPPARSSEGRVAGNGGSSDGVVEVPLRCLCRHNTAGDDCERCAPFHYDRPWAPATATDARECKPCQCHGHSRVCRFNMELYKLSGFRSGGVCVRCRHNTAGRHCHHCREGFYRDASLPPTHRRVCRACDCHPVGSLGRTCNMTTGQCPCKDGVTGQTCNRCQKGHQQSRSPIAPCVRIPQFEGPPPIAADGPADGADYPESDEDGDEDDNDAEDDEDDDEECPRECPQELTFATFCKKDFAIRATVVSRETFGSWARFAIEINKVYRSTSPKLKRGSNHFWVPLANLKCRCPHIKIRTTYLIIGARQMHAGRLSPTADPDGVVLAANQPAAERRVRKMARKRKRCTSQ